MAAEVFSSFSFAPSLMVRLDPGAFSMASSVRGTGSPTGLPSMSTWNLPVGALQVTAVPLAERTVKATRRCVPGSLSVSFTSS